MRDRYTRRYWLDVADRTVSTSAQAFLAYATVGAFDVLAFDWVAGGSVALSAAVLTVVKALAVRNVGTPETGGVA